MSEKPIFTSKLSLWNKVGLSIATLFFIVSLVVTILLAYNKVSPPLEKTLNFNATSSSIKYIKKSLNIPRNFLVRELNLSLKVSNRLPLSKLGISQEKLNFTIKRAFYRYQVKDLKNSIFFMLSFFGLMVLIYISQRNQRRLRPVYKWEVRCFYIFSLIFSILICGFLLGKSPNPMECFVKGVKIAGGIATCSFNNVIVLILLAIATIIGNKIICGWACPFGALQELSYIISSRIKKYTLPFYVTNSIRALVFFVALFILFGFIGDSYGLMLYHKINPFNIFTPYFKPIFVLFSILFFLVLSLFFYRPFCQFICPFGLFSWLVEFISLFKIKVDCKKCIKCGSCYKSCPTGAIKDKVMNKKIAKECYSCGRCLNQCPVRAIRYD